MRDEQEYVGEEVEFVRVLMLGWEFPPFFAGGIGIVCYELSKALCEQGVEVSYIMPFGPRNSNPGFLKKLIIAENLMPTVKVHRVKTMMHAYMSAEEYEQTYESTMLTDNGGDYKKKKLYGKDLMQEVHNFAHRAMAIADADEFDVIHCHDWMTIPAAVGIKQRTGRPLVVHVHNTVFDRYLSGDNKVEYDIEQLGLNEADQVVCISNYVRTTLLKNYRIDPAKIRVIHNAAQRMGERMPTPKVSAKDKIVLFAGRITIQKGPDYFIRAARLVVDHDPNVKFVMAGSGDMLHNMIDLVADLGLSENFLFPGFYTRDEAERLFSMADVFVMPSVSEPFGIVPLEAMYKGTPTIISKQSGVSEVLNHVLKVDFWDVEELAEKILAVLAYEELHNTLSQHGNFEVKTLTWDKSAQKVRELYEDLVQFAVHRG